MLLNGKNWHATDGRININKSCSNTILMAFDYRNKQGYVREIMGFTKILQKTGSFSLKSFDYTSSCREDSLKYKNIVGFSYGTSQDDGDVVKDIYNVLEIPSEKNKITIDKYINTGKKYISGSFNVTLLLKRNPDGTKQYQDSPDTIRITNARFEASGF